MIPYLYVFNAADSMRSPTESELNIGYSIVLWYTADDSTDLYLWNASDTDNTYLSNFLSSGVGTVFGSKLILFGSNFLKDRYPSTPVTFNQDSFCDHFLGINQYLGESYIDDSGSGSFFLTRNMALDPLSFDYFPFDSLPDTLSWDIVPHAGVDICNADSAAWEVQTFYVHKPDTYLFANKSAGTFVRNEQGFWPPDIFWTYTFFFDPFDFKTKSMRDNFIKWIVQYMGSETYEGIFDNYDSYLKIHLFPNPTTSLLHFTLPSSETIQRIIISTADGRVVRVVDASALDSKNEMDVSDLRAGFYFMRVETENSVIQSKFLKL